MKRGTIHIAKGEFEAFREATEFFEESEFRITGMRIGMHTGNTRVNFEYDERFIADLINLGRCWGRNLERNPNRKAEVAV